MANSQLDLVFKSINISPLFSGNAKIHSLTSVIGLNCDGEARAVEIRYRQEEIGRSHEEAFQYRRVIKGSGYE